MKKLLYLLLLLPSLAIGQVINPTPDMVFKGQLGAGRGIGTDPSAWFSIGPTVGSVRGVVFPQVSDTNSVVSPRRNGLFIWSLQRSRFMYWDSVAVRWKQIPDISNIDTMVVATRAWRQKGDDSLGVIINARVPVTRTVTINGNTQDLSANRSWNVGTVRQVNSGTGLNGGPVTDSGTLAVDTFVISTRVNVKKLGDSLLSVINTRVDTNYISTRAWRQKGIDSVTLLVNQRVPSVRTITINGVPQDLTADRTWIVGTVTNIFTGYGLSGGPISVSGTVQADSLTITSRLRLQKVADSLSLLISNAGGGTVTSVASGTGMSFPTITNSGSVAVDTVMMSTRLWRQKGIDSVNLQFGGKVDTSRSITINGNTQTLSANRTWNVGTVTSVSATGSSGITVSGSPIISTGTLAISGDTSLLSTRAWRQKGDDSLSVVIDTKTPLIRTISINGTAQNLTDDRAWSVGTVTSVASGYGLSGGPVTSTGTISADSASITSRPRLQKVADSLALLISSSGGGTVLSVSAGTGMSFPTITSTGSVSVDTASMSTRLWRQKGIDSANVLISQRVRISDTAAMLLPYVRHAGFGLIKIPTDAGKTQGLSVDTSLVSTKAWRQKGVDSVAALFAASGSGTVTSITAGIGLTGGTITSSGTVALDTTVASTRAWRQKGDDSLGAIIATKEPLIAAGTTAQYWRGDKSWQTLNTTAVPEGTRLYYTDTRSRAAISLTTTGSSGASTYDSIAGVLNVPNYTLSGLGGVPSTRVITINGSAQDLSTNRTWNVGTVTGSGDSNYVARFRPGGTVIGNGIMYDNGSRVSIGTTAAASRFHVVTPDIIGQTISSQSALAAASMQFTNGSNATYVGVNSSAGSSLLAGSGAYNSFVGSGSAYGLDLGTNSITRMSILSGGQVRVNDLSGSGTRMVVTDSSGRLLSQAIPSGLAGSGTANYISKWTPNGTTLGDSRLFDNGTNIGIGTNTFSFTTGTGIHLKTAGDANIKVSSATNAGFDIVQDVAANVFAYNRDNAAVILGTQNTERLRITGAGNIQVNSDTSMGAFRFQVAGNAIVRDGFTVRGLAGVGTRMVVSDGVGNLSTQAIPSGGGGVGGSGIVNRVVKWTPNGTTLGNTIMHDTDSTMSVGTNPSSSNVRFDVLASTNRQDGIGIRSSSNGGINGIALLGEGSANSGDGNNYAVYGSSFGARSSGTNIGGYFDAGNAPTNNALITGNGNVGIGTSSPEQKLDVNGKVRIRIVDSINSPTNILYQDPYGVVKKASVASISSGGASVDTTLLSTRAWRQKGDDSLGALIDTKVPKSRTLNINGVSFDLSLDRYWSIGAVRIDSLRDYGSSKIMKNKLGYWREGYVMTIRPQSPGFNMTHITGVAYIPLANWSQTGWNEVALLPPVPGGANTYGTNGGAAYFSGVQEFDNASEYYTQDLHSFTGSTVFSKGPSLMVRSSSSIILAKGVVDTSGPVLTANGVSYVAIAINASW